MQWALYGSAGKPTGHLGPQRSLTIAVLDAFEPFGPKFCSKVCDRVDVSRPLAEDAPYNRRERTKEMDNLLRPECASWRWASSESSRQDCQSVVLFAAVCRDVRSSGHVTALCREQQQDNSPFFAAFRSGKSRRTGSVTPTKPSRAFVKLSVDTKMTEIGRRD